MKKLFAIILALAVALAAQTFAETEETAPAEPFRGCWQDPLYGRAVLKIMPATELDVPDDETWYDVKMTWGASADSEGVWYMSARYDAQTDSLVYTDGVMSYLTYAGNGLDFTEEKQWEDAEGAFTLSDGKLLWNDSREERAADFAFEPMQRLAPEADELRDRFFLAVADLEQGTTGSSLKLAALTADLLAFACEYTTWYADAPALQANLLTAWTALDDGTRQRFDENMPAVEALMADALGYYVPLAGQFEDAGAGYMAYLAENSEARLCWEAFMDSLRTLASGE